LVQRTRGRSKLTATHFGLDDTGLETNLKQWINANRMVMTELQNKNIPILRLDAANSINVNQQITEDFLERIATGSQE